jgi:hypothetical protein
MKFRMQIRRKRLGIIFGLLVLVVNVTITFLVAGLLQLIQLVRVSL